MRKFEYTTLNMPAKGFWVKAQKHSEELTQKLNELGSKGWEVVSSYGIHLLNPAARGIHIILKREINH